MNIYYSFYHKDGIEDLPTLVSYPNLTLKTGTSNILFFDLNIGDGLNLNQLGIEIDAKLSDNALISPTHRGINRACLFGTSKTDDEVGWYIHSDNTASLDSPEWFYYIYIGSSDNIFLSEKTSGLNEPSGITGFVNKNKNLNIYKQGKMLYRNIAVNKILTSNLTLLRGNDSALGYVYGSEMEISHCKITKNNEIIRDLIPIDSKGVKNGFVNTYGIGLYDINTMEFISPSAIEGEQSLLPHILPLPPEDIEYPKI